MKSVLTELARLMASSALVEIPLVTSIAQVVLNKYHTVFLTDSGAVYTCGHGLGGRLGHGDELTALVRKLC